MNLSGLFVFSIVYYRRRFREKQITSFYCLINVAYILGAFYGYKSGMLQSVLLCGKI